MEVEKVDHVAARDAVREVARYPAAEEPEADLRVGDPEPERPPAEEDRDQGGRRERGEQDAPARDDAPRGPGVSDVDDVEESPDDGDRARALPVGVEGQARADPGL